MFNIKCFGYDYSFSHLHILNLPWHSSGEGEKCSIRVGTADLLNMLIEDEPHVDFTLALGVDTSVDLSSGKWRRTEEEFKLVGHRMVVFRRLSDAKDEIERGEEIQRGIAKWQLLNETKSSIRLVNIPSLTDVSSSTVRSTSDENFLNSLVTKPVLDYIRQNNLYAFSKPDIK